jgi:hypothetical protein
MWMPPSLTVTYLAHTLSAAADRAIAKHIAPLATASQPVGAFHDLSLPGIPPPITCMTPCFALHQLVD